MKNLYNSQLSILVILYLVSCLPVFGQENDSSKILIAQRIKSGLQIVLDSGMTIRYHTHTFYSEDYEKGLISGFTDSTILITKKKEGSILIPIKDLKVVVVPRTKGKIITGSVFIAFATLWASGLFAKDELSRDLAAVAFIIISIPSYIIGYSLLKPKKLELKQKWMLRTVRVSEIRK